MKRKNLVRSFLLFFVLAVVFYSLIGKVAGLKNVEKIFTQINPVFLCLALTAWILTFGINALKFKTILEAQNYKVKFLELVYFSMVGVFAIHFFPVGNFGESAFSFYLLRKRGVKSMSALALFLIRLIFDYFAFFLLAAIALATLEIHPSFNWLIKIIFGFILSALIGGTFYLRYLLHHPKKFTNIAKPILFYLRKSFNFIRNHSDKAESKYYEKLSQELYSEIKKIVSPKKKLLLLFVSSFLYWCLDALILYFSLLGLGATLGLNAVIVSYAVASLLGSISFLPAGIGALEGSLIFMLYKFLPLSTLLTLAVLNYRFISLWLAIPVGMGAFWALKKKQTTFVQTEKVC
ncbi:flippase-like domain-containing protein [bacterium]|nr:flippase-like domain-containing protein [bacterium]